MCLSLHLVDESRVKIHIPYAKLFSAGILEHSLAISIRQNVYPLPSEKNFQAYEYLHNIGLRSHQDIVCLGLSIKVVAPS